MLNKQKIFKNGKHCITKNVCVSLEYKYEYICIWEFDDGSDCGLSYGVKSEDNNLDFDYESPKEVINVRFIL